ncbi:MAG: hypothetical protein H6Q76_2343 [Firmicutes bacterium]|nr:hypothetical protein [Bacillota bacterium]
MKDQYIGFLRPRPELVALIGVAPEGVTVASAYRCGTPH